MDTNELDPQLALIPRGATEVDTPPPSRPGWLWRGVKTGFRCVSYVVGSAAAVALILGLARTAFSVGSGRGWGVHQVLPAALVFCLECALWGVILCAAIGLVGPLIWRAHSGARTPTWWMAVNRLVRLFPRTRSTATPIDAGPLRPRRRRWPWRVGVPVLLVLAAPFGVGVYLGRMVDRRLTDAIAVADGDNPSWRLDDLMANRDPVPDVENSALVVAEVCSLLPKYWPPDPESLLGEPKLSPTEVMEGYELDSGRSRATADNLRLDDAAAGTLRGELEAHAEAVKIARTVADYRRGRHELELRPALIDTLLPQIQTTRSAALLLAADAAIRVHDGDPDGALDSCRAILGVGRSIGDEPFLIFPLVRASIGDIALNATHRVLGQGEPSEAALARLQALILDELAQPLLLQGLQGERAILTEFIRRVGAGEVPISALRNVGPPFDSTATRAAIAAIALSGELWFDLQRAVALEWLNELVAIARRPPAARPPLWEAREAHADLVKRSRLGRFTAMLPLLLMPDMSGAATALSRYQSVLGATAILLAAERHRRRAGDWPASIASIDPAILARPPDDPFSGQPFRMERRNGHTRSAPTSRMNTALSIRGGG
jgi:hypothetical protein